LKDSYDFSKGRRGAVISTGTEHITPVGGNVFLNLGFLPEVAEAMKAEADHRRKAC